jgi:DNA-binding CsgD family transcriptional regulator
VVELCLRGATFEQIGRQLNIDRSTAYKAWQRTLKRLPTADVASFPPLFEIEPIASRS